MPLGSIKDELLFHRVDGLAQISGLRNVAGYRGGFTAKLFNLFDRALQPLARSQVEAPDGSPSFRQAQGYTLANTAARARNKRNLSFKAEQIDNLNSVVRLFALCASVLACC